MAVLEDVHKSYGDHAVLAGLDLEARPGEITVVVGGSGSGKSTALRILLGLETFDSGSVRLLGRRIDQLPRREMRTLMMEVGVLFQFGALFDSMTVAENVGFALRHNRHRPDDEIAAVVEEKLRLVGLQDIEERVPAELSGGMRKRVALARAIAHSPRLLLVDEPTTGLDPITSAQIHALIVQMRERLGVTVLCITHDISSALHIADRIAMIHEGRIIAVGTPDEMRASEHDVVREFLAAEHGRPAL